MRKGKGESFLDQNWVFCLYFLVAIIAVCSVATIADFSACTIVMTIAG
jgi:hypothetical protein